MNNNLTHLALVIDRSGSMASMREETENAINHLLNDQKQATGQCMVTLTQFDNEYDILYDNVDITELPEKPYELVPRGMTALYDAVGRTIVKVGETLSAMPEEERPAAVVFVVATDGLNNASQEYTIGQIRKMIEHQKTTYSWKFLFLGVDIDAEDIGTQLGVGAASSVSVRRHNTGVAYNMTSNKLSAVRHAVGSGVNVNNVDMSYKTHEKEQCAS